MLRGKWQQQLCRICSESGVTPFVVMISWFWEQMKQPPFKSGGLTTQHFFFSQMSALRTPSVVNQANYPMLNTVLNFPCKKN